MKQLNLLFNLSLLISFLTIFIVVLNILLPFSRLKPEAAWCGVTGVSENLNYNIAIVAGGNNNKTGENIFRNNCSPCHAIKDIIVGPALADIGTRRSRNWLYKFINNSRGMVESGDSSAVQLFEKFNQTEMPSFSFTEAEIDSILEYIHYETVIRN